MIGFWIFNNRGELLTGRPCDELLFGLVKSTAHLTANVSRAASESMVANSPLKTLQTGKYTLQVQSSLTGKILVVALGPTEKLLPNNTLSKILSHCVKNPADVSLNSLKEFQL